MIGISEKEERSIVDAAVAYSLSHGSNRPLSTVAERVFGLIKERGLMVVENRTDAVSRR